LSVSGTRLRSRPCSGAVTLNTMMSGGTMSSPSGNGAGASFVRTNDFPRQSEKSITTSRRSAGAMRSWVRMTGAGRRPPSLPICWNTGPVRPSGCPRGELSCSVMR
jgi:hypothetical protein